MSRQFKGTPLVLPASPNRRMRRAMGKVKRDPFTIRLLNWSGDTATAGVFYDIMNTGWRGASKCSYVYEIGDTFFDVLNKTKLYFAPILDKLQFNCRSHWAAETRLLFTMQTGGWLVNITYKRENPKTVTLFLPGYVMDVSKLASHVQRKSSTFFQDLNRTAYMCKTSYSPEKKADSYEEYIAQGMSDRWAAVLSGKNDLSDIEGELCFLLIEELMTEFLQIFRTLAFIDYSVQMGNDIYMNDVEIALLPSTLADIESRCAACTSDVSSVPINACSDDMPSKNIIGESTKITDYFKGPAASTAISWLQKNCLEDTIDLDSINEKGQESYFFLDKNGNPMELASATEFRISSWMVAATGLTSRRNRCGIFALYSKLVPGDCWVFERFATMFGIYSIFEEKHSKNLSIQKWQPLLSPKFVLRGVGLRSTLNPDMDIMEEVCFYHCSPAILEQLGDSSNIKTLDQMNFFLDGFIRMCRRRKVDCGVRGVYNTGLVDKTGRYVYLAIPNISGPRLDIQPSLLDIRASDSRLLEPIVPFNKASDLMYKQSNIELDEQALLHIVFQRDYRIPDKLLNFSKEAFIECVRDSIRHAQAMFQVNPVFAQPCYSVQLDKVCYLIPLYTAAVYDEEHLAGALFIRNGRVATLYTVEMARDHACMFSIPKAVWLPD